MAALFSRLCTHSLRLRHSARRASLPRARHMPVSASGRRARALCRAACDRGAARTTRAGGKPAAVRGLDAHRHRHPALMLPLGDGAIHRAGPPARHQPPPPPPRPALPCSGPTKYQRQTRVWSFFRFLFFDMFPVPCAAFWTEAKEKRGPSWAMEWLCRPGRQGTQHQAGCCVQMQACDPCHSDSRPATGGAAPGPAPYPPPAAAHRVSSPERTGLDGFDARSERWRQKAAAMQLPAAAAELAAQQAHREEQKRAHHDYMDAGLFRAPRSRGVDSARGPLTSMRPNMRPGTRAQPRVPGGAYRGRTWSEAGPAPCALLSSAACAPVLAHAPDARGGAMPAEASLGQRKTTVQMQGGRQREQKMDVGVSVLLTLDARAKIDQAWRHARFCKNRIAAADWHTALAHRRAGQDLLKSVRVVSETDQVDFDLLRAVRIRALSSPRGRCASRLSVHAPRAVRMLK